MIRKPLPSKLRIVISVASILVMILLYTWLSESRQSSARATQVSEAKDTLATQRDKLTELQAELAEHRSMMAERGFATAVAVESKDTEEKQEKTEEEKAADLARAKLEQLEASLQQTQVNIKDAEQKIAAPDKSDLTVPSWSHLWHDGLVRSLTPQGRFKKKETWLFIDFWATGKRLVTALSLGIFLSIVVGILMGCYEPIEAFFMPPFAFLTKIPATAVLPIFFAVMDIDFTMFVVIIIFGMMPSLAQSISASVKKDVPDELVYKAYTLGASQAELIWNVIFRQVLPRVIDAARLQIGPALVLLVAAEWMVAGEGIGYRLRLFYQRTDMTIVFVYVLILGILGLAADYGLNWLRRKLCPWFGD